MSKALKLAIEQNDVERTRQAVQKIKDINRFFPRRFRTTRRLDSDALFPQSAFALNLRGSPFSIPKVLSDCLRTEIDCPRVRWTDELFSNTETFSTLTSSGR